MNPEDTAVAYDAILDKQSQKSASTGIKQEEATAAKAQLDSVLAIVDQYQQQENAPAVNAADLAFLAKEGLDVASLLQSASISKDCKKSMSPVETIQHNAILLFELHKLQEERFSSKSQIVGAREQELGKCLLIILTRIISIGHK
jgi:hypothetical protein